MRRSLYLNGALAVVIATLAIGGYVATKDSSASTSSTATLSTAKRGIVLQSVSATGNVEAPSAIGVNFQQSGRITSVAVSAGDRVQAGDVLATVEATSQASALASAKASLASAKAQLAAKRRGQTAAERAQNAVGLTQSQLAVQNAQKALDRAKATAAANSTKYDLQVTQAAAQVDAASQTAEQNARKYVLSLNQAYAQLSSAQSSEAKAKQDLSDTTSSLQSLQSSYDPSRSTTETTTHLVNRYKLDQSDCSAHSSTTNYTPSDGVTCSQVANLLSLAQNVSSAESSYTQAQSTTASNQRAVDTAIQNQASGQVSDQQQVASAQRSLDTAKQNRTAGLLSDAQQIETSEASLATSQLSLESTKAGNAVKETTKPEDIIQSQASVASAEAQVATAQKNMGDTVLRAPVDGTVASVSGEVGGYPSSGSSSASSSASSSSSSSASSTSASGFVVLTNLDLVDVKVGFSETDAAKVKVGQQATITVDALGTATIQGTVLALDVDKTLVSNVVTYYAKVGFASKPAGLKPGMTAAVSVVLDKRDDVVSLPTAAVPTQGTTASVTVRDAKGNDAQRTVGIGLRGDTAVEITSGLQVGDTVVTTSTATAGGTGGFRPPGGAGGGPGGGIGGGIGGGR